MRELRIWCVLVFGFAACGDDGGSGSGRDAAVDSPRQLDAAIDAPGDAPPPGVCGASGNATVNGMVMGVTIAPVVRAYEVSAGNQGTAIVLDEVAGSCGQLPTSGEHLALLFCAPPPAGTYPVVGEQAFMCPSNNAFGLVEQNGSMDYAESVGGTITITGRSSTCVSGMFSINYMNAEQLSGSFNAVICP